MEYQTELKEYNGTAHLRFTKQITDLLNLEQGTPAKVIIEDDKIVVEIVRPQVNED